MIRRFPGIRARLLLALGLSIVLVLALSGTLLAAYRQLTTNIVNSAYSQTLSVMAARVEEGLRGVRDLAVRVATDPDFQSRVLQLNREDDRYERSLRSDELVARMVVLGSRPHLAAMYVVDATGEVTASRLDYPELSTLVEAQQMLSFEKSSEPYRWVYTASESPVFLLLARIRRVEDLGLEQIGILVLVVDKERFVRWVFRQRFGPQLELAILLDRSLLYTSNNELDPQSISAELANSGYGTLLVGNRRYFATTIEASESSLRYVAMVPHATLLGPIQSYNRIALAAYVLLGMVLFFVAARTARNISQPVVHLANEMKRIESEDFTRIGLDLSGEGRPDEIGVLYHEFRVLLERIDTLFNENYRKQLLIQDARYRTLQAQINPHFLYNTLESINWLAQLNDQQVIASMVQALGDLLRASISGKRLGIRLAEEIELLRQYVLIQKLRYGERLETEISLSESVAEAGIPKLTLQPFVENSIKYGLEAATGTCHVRVVAEQRGANVSMTIADDGPGIESGLARRIELGKVEARGSGLGINNIRQRMSQIYGPDCAVGISSIPGGGTTVTLEMPVLSVEELNALVEGSS